MKRCLLIILLCGTTPLFAGDVFTTRQNPLSFGYRKSLFMPLLCGNNGCNFPVAKSTVFTNRFAVDRQFPLAYSGIPFHNAAVFCRMENHFLNTYSVKFSIHAGGYRE